MKIPFLGKLLEVVADKAGGIISELVTDKDLAKRLDHEFRSLLSTQNSDIKKLELQIEADMFQSQQVTIQAELHQTDVYTKQTRPKIARQSWRISVFYAIWSMLDGVLLHLFGAEPDVITQLDIAFVWEVYLAIAAPALTYMGVREFGKWKNPGQ